MMYDDYSQKLVPQHYKYSALWLFMLIMGIAICLPLFVFGAQMGQSFTLRDYLWITLLGGLLTGVLMALTSAMGAKTRMSAVMYGRVIFGHRGGFFVAFLLFASAIGWWGVQTEVMARALTLLLHETYGVHVAAPWFVVLGGGLMMTTSLLGIKAIGKLSFIAVPLMMGLLIYPLFIAQGLDFRALWQADVRQTILPGVVVAGIVGAWMSGVVSMPDLTRFMMPRAAFFGAFWACAVGYPGLMLLSGLLGSSLGNTDFISVFPVLGLGLVAIVTAVLSTWTSNDANLYSAALPLCLYSKVSRFWLTFIAGMVGIILASFGIFSRLEVVFVWFGVWLAPLAALMLMTFWLMPDWYKGKKLPQVRWKPFMVFAVGLLVGLATTPVEGLGLGWMTLTTASTIDGFVAAALMTVVAYWPEFKKRLGW